MRHTWAGRRLSDSRTDTSRIVEAAHSSIHVHIDQGIKTTPWFQVNQPSIFRIRGTAVRKLCEIALAKQYILVALARLDRRRPGWRGWQVIPRSGRRRRHYIVPVLKDGLTCCCFGVFDASTTQTWNVYRGRRIWRLSLFPVNHPVSAFAQPNTFGFRHLSHSFDASLVLVLRHLPHVNFHTNQSRVKMRFTTLFTSFLAVVSSVSAIAVQPRSATPALDISPRNLHEFAPRQVVAGTVCATVGPVRLLNIEVVPVSSSLCSKHVDPSVAETKSLRALADNLSLYRSWCLDARVAGSTHGCGHRFLSKQPSAWNGQRSPLYHRPSLDRQRKLFCSCCTPSLPTLTL